MNRQMMCGFQFCKGVLFLLLVMPFLTMAGNVVVTSVTAKQRDTWTGLVDIAITIQGEADDVSIADCLFAATNRMTRMKIPLEHITREGSDLWTGVGWTRKFVWDAFADIGAVKIDDVELTVDAKSMTYVQLWQNGPYWAKCNVGATRPEECGRYFWWGDRVGYKWENEKWGGPRTDFSFNGGSCPTYNKTLSQLGTYLGNYLYGDYSSHDLVASYDGATAHLGTPWRLPTAAEFGKLCSECSTTWTVRNGVMGRLVTGKGAYALRSIFIPAAGMGSGTNYYYYGSSGYYWSSTVESPSSYSSDSRVYFAKSLYFDDGYIKNSSAYSYHGFPIRPVRGSAEISSGVDAVTTHLTVDCRSSHQVVVVGVTAQLRRPRDGSVDVVVKLQGPADEVAKTECSFVAANAANNATISVAHITRKGPDSGSGLIWTRQFVWDAALDVVKDIGAVRFDQIKLTVSANMGVQLWENGPSWAECNVGATKPTEKGYYFWWGDTEGYVLNGGKWSAVDGSKNDFRFTNANCPTLSKSNSALLTSGYVDSNGNLVDRYDAARVNFDIPWRMPSEVEIAALINNCTMTRTNGGCRVTGKGVYASRSIFLPTGGYGGDSSLYNSGEGYYWSSTPYTSDSSKSWFLSFTSRNFSLNSYLSRCNGLLVRPVRGFVEGMTTYLEWEQQSDLMIRDGGVVGWDGGCPEHIEIPEGVISIEGGAFRDCYDLVSVTLPSTLKYIGKDAFRGCTSLEYVELPEGLEDVGEGAFRDCTWMQEVKFPSSLTNIGKLAFANCTMLDGVECFDGLESVGEGAFSNCWRMLSVAFPVTVNEIGERAFYNCKSVLGVSVPAHVDTIAHLFPSVYQTLQSVAVAEGETELVAGFFGGCKMLQEIVLSNAIREIPDSTFEGCTELLRVWLPSELLKIGNRAFYGCGKLSSIEFPSGLVSIGDSAFYGCGCICELKFPDGLVEIGADAFNGLPYVLGITCPVSVKKIGARAFKGVWNDLEIKLPEGLESLGADAFANCASIRRVALPVLATSIKSAFSAAYTQIESVKILGQPEVILKDFCRDVTKLADIQIPASVTNIESYAFSGLSNLAGIELPSGLRTIGEYAFNGDSRLATIALPQSLESVGYRAFYGCSNVRSVSCSGELGTMSTLFPSAYTQITSVSINEGTTLLIDDLLFGCTKLSDVDLPAGVVEIGARAFKNCSALAAFGVPNGVVTLGNDVFYGCTGLTALSLPEGLENIPSGAFQNCRAISSLVIPASVDYIGANAFSGCTALKSVSYLGSCPEFDGACYSGTPSDLSSYVVFGSRGWDGIPTSRTLPESWPTANARAITYWEPNTFAATFDGNGGTPSSSVVVQTTGMTYVLPEENPEMLGARFDGWWTQPVNGGRIKSTTKVEVTRAQTFYAHWKYNGYSVRFDANGGIGEMEGQVMTVNTPAELAPNRYLRKGYRFEGWALSSDGEVAFADGEKVENLSFEHNAVVPLYAVWAEQPWDAADYLNASGRAFAFDGDAEWVADDEISHDGIGSMRSGVIAAADEGEKTASVMQTTVVGTGSGSFWWKVDCEPADGSDYFDYCAFFVDGTEVAKIAGTEDWGKVDYVVTGEGEHVLKWVFTRDDWDEDESFYENAAWVDEFEWAPTPVTLSFDAGGADGEVPASVTKYAGYEMSLPSPSMLTKDGMVFVGWSDGVSVFRSGDVYAFGSVDAVLCAVWEEKTWTLEEAANLTGLTIVTGGDANWTVDLDKNYDGVASIRSGVIGDDQQTWVSIDVEGSGTVAFRTFVSGEFYRGKKCDYLKFEVDGAEEFSSYDADWSNVVVKVSGRGTHTLKWTYLKNASKSAGDDCAWLDEIIWEAEAETEVVPTIAELAEVFGGESDVVKGVKDETQLAAFNQFLKDCAIASASDLSAGQKTWAYQSFKLFEIMTAPQLFEEEPVLKFDDIELNDGNLALTVSLHAGAEAITLAKDKLAEKIRVGTSLDAIGETPQILASPSADGTTLTFTVAPPQGEKGFVRILIE